MTVDEVLAQEDITAAGRTGFEDREPLPIEVLAAEVRRLRAACDHQLNRIVRFKLERDAAAMIANHSPSDITRNRMLQLAGTFVEK
jgi:hypothetical protein